MEPPGIDPVHLPTERTIHHMTELDPIRITGGSGGLGASLVRHLAGDCEVLTVGRRIDPINREYADEPHVHPYERDLANPDAITAFLAERPDKMFADEREAGQ